MNTGSGKKYNKYTDYIPADWDHYIQCVDCRARRSYICAGLFNKVRYYFLRYSILSSVIRGINTLSRDNYVFVSF